MRNSTLSTVLAFLLIIFLSTYSVKVYSQSDNAGNSIASNLTIAVKGAYTYGVLSEDYSSRFTKHRHGYAGGLSISYYIMDWMAINPEFWYFEHGGNDVPQTLFYPDAGFTLDTNRTTNLEIRRVEMPLLAVIHIPGMSGGFQPKIMIGPSFGYNFQSVLINKRDLPTSETEIITRDDATEQIKMWEYAVTAGAGVNLKMGSMILMLEARYRAGFYNIHNRDNSEDFVTNTLVFSAGIGF